MASDHNNKRKRNLYDNDEQDEKQPLKKNKLASPSSLNETNRLLELKQEADKKVKKKSKKAVEKKKKKEIWKTHAQQSEWFVGMDLSKNSPAICVWNTRAKKIDIVAVCRSRRQLTKWKEILLVSEKTSEEEGASPSCHLTLATPVTLIPPIPKKKKSQKQKEETYQVGYHLFDKQSFVVDTTKEDKEEEENKLSKECDENSLLCQAWENAFQVLDMILSQENWKTACVVLEGCFVDNATRSAAVLGKIHGMIQYLLWKRHARFHILAPTTIKALFGSKKGAGSASKDQMWLQFLKVTKNHGFALEQLHPGIQKQTTESESKKKIPNPHQDIVDAFAICFVTRFCH